MDRSSATGPADDSEAIRAYADRMAALEKIKSDFLNLASHELRGPLTILTGYTAMMEDGSLGELSPQVKQILPIFLAKTRQMSLLVNQMLEAARLEDARLHLNIGRVDLSLVVRGAVAIVGGLTQAGQAVLMRSPQRPVWVLADEARLESVAASLLDNAIKYSPGGGDIEITVRQDGREASVEVSDRGLGIAPEDMPQLFTRFGRIITPDNSHIPGTGLGLYVAREVMRLHGGDIDVEARESGGTKFTLRLPSGQGLDSAG